MCQLDTGATCYAISHRNLVQLLQNGDPPIRKSNSQLKLFEGILHTYIHTLFIPEADDNYYIQIKLKRKYF